MTASKLPASALALLISLGPCLVFGQEGDQTNQGSPAKTIAPISKIELFNGKNLNGFYTYLQDTKYEDPRNVFRVTDGMIHITGDGYGSLITDKFYRDYHAVVEYRWGDQTWGNRKKKTKDSGFLVHGVGPDGGYNGRWMPSIEVQIIQGGVGDFILVVPDDPKSVPVPFSLTCETRQGSDGGTYWDKGGKKVTVDRDHRRRINWFGRDSEWKDVINYRGQQDPDSPGHEWTRLDVICKGDTIRTFVNGVQVNAAIACSPSQGRLQLQTEQAEIFVRRFELYPAGDGPKPAAIE